MKRISLPEHARCHPLPARTVLGLIIRASLGGCHTTGNAQVDPLDRIEQRVQGELDRLRDEHGFPGATAAFMLPDGQIGLAATGYADVEKQIPMTPEAVMPAGSIGKSFVAGVVLDLVREGQLSLDAPIEGWFASDSWFERLPNGKDLTLRMLLNHSSGLEDFLSTEQMFMGFYRTVSDSVDFPFSNEEKVQAVLDVEPRFPAGEGYYYTDTNYILVGLIIERVTGTYYFPEHDVAVAIQINTPDRNYTAYAEAIADIVVAAMQ